MLGQNAKSATKMASKGFQMTADGGVSDECLVRQGGDELVAAGSAVIRVALAANADRINTCPLATTMAAKRNSMLEDILISLCLGIWLPT
jgi:hypothetical protein